MQLPPGMPGAAEMYPRGLRLTLSLYPNFVTSVNAGAFFPKARTFGHTSFYSNDIQI